MRFLRLVTTSSAPTRRGQEKIVAVYDYVDELGRLVFQVVRKEPKEFLQRRPDVRGGWIWNTKGCPVLPYRLPELLEAASTGGTVFVVEGEKDANAAFEIGLVATCNARGAGKWMDEHSEYLRGADVVLVPDNDQPGRDHVAKVANSLRAKASRIRIVELKGAKDLSDWIAAGHTANELMRLCEAAGPWEPKGSRKPAVDNTAGATRVIGLAASSSEEPEIEITDWPIMGSPASLGLVGEIAKLATLRSEADLTAVMGTALTWGGATLGRNRFFRVGDTIYHARLNCALVGKSGRARKGTSMAPVQRIYGAAERILQQQSTRPFPSGLSLKVSHGPLSSGEGLIYAIRDGDGEKDGEEGVLDKRLLCAEGEFGAALRAFQRQGNTLSQIIRSAWDGTNLGPLVKHNRTFASNPHICLMAHITRHELIGLLGNSDIFNGFANRFIWMAVRRGPITASPKPMPDADVEAIAKELARVVAYAHGREGSRAELVRSNSAEELWATCYPELTQDRPGVLGAVTDRMEAQVTRLSMVYAQLDGADFIEEKHLEAALTFWALRSGFGPPHLWRRGGRSDRATNCRGPR